LTKQDDISSTEKLLDSIRNKSNEIEIEEEKIELLSSQVESDEKEL